MGGKLPSSSIVMETKTLWEVWILGLQKQITQTTLSIGNGVGDNWENVRILLWGQNRELLAILHAKKSTVVKDREAGSIELFLEQVDYESLLRTQHRSTKKSSFVSFEKWKQPMRFIDTQFLIGI